MTITYIEIENQTLTSTQSTIEFTSIPQEYKDLVLVCVPKTTGGGNSFMRFNNDSSSIYTRGAMAVESGSVTNQFLSGQTSIRLNLSVDLPVNLGDVNSKYDILEYSSTDKHTVVLGRANRDPIDRLEQICGRYGSTSAVTSISLFPSTGSWDAGAVFTLYGIAG